jgi:APA family basic amino acid/polyamine antiporter
MTPRRVGVIGAVGIGVGSMLGAGVFSDMWAHVLAAGDWYLVAVAIAAAVATANALSTAQLASRYHLAGGVYAYGRAELGNLVGHLAGAGFVVGKTVSTAVAALVLGAYVLPGHAPTVATGAIALAWALNARGITRTAAGATVSAVVVTVGLVAIAVGALVIDDADSSSVLILHEAHGPAMAVLVGAAAALFAFAGYARIATLSEDVRDPGRTIPRAIAAALGIVLVVYCLVAVALATTVGADRLSAAAPIEQLAAAARLPAWPVTVLATVAVFGAMLAVMAGAGRTVMAMARERDLPHRLADQGTSGAPWKAEAVVAVVAVALVWFSTASLILVSVTGVLVYYGVANLAAIRQRRAGRTAYLRVPVAVSVFGLVGCATLGAVALPAAADGWLTMAVVLALVVGWPVVAALVRR